MRSTLLIYYYFIDALYSIAPVVFVDYQRLDYGQPGNELLEYYFVFLREKQSRNSMGTDVITRVLRLCRVSVHHLYMLVVTVLDCVANV